MPNHYQKIQSFVHCSSLKLLDHLRDTINQNRTDLKILISCLTLENNVLTKKVMRVTLLQGALMPTLTIWATFCCFQLGPKCSFELTIVEPYLFLIKALEN